MTRISIFSLDALFASRPGRPRRGFWDFDSLFRQRQSLRNLDDAALRDVGLSRDEAEAEADRPVWDTPAHWR